MTPPRREGLLPSILALVALALALHAGPLRGDALASWSVVGAGPPWSQKDAPATNVLADYDPVALELPEAMHLRRTGGAPWNPLLGLGEPCGLASWPTLTWPPAVVAYRLLQPWTATSLLSLLNVLGGGVVCLLWLRWRGHPARAALLGAIAYELSPFFSAWLARPWITHLMPWAALALWGAELMGRRPGPRPLAVIGLAVGASLLGGFPQLALLVAALVPIVAVAAGAGARVRARAAVLSLIAVGLGGAVAAARLVPLSVVVEATSRAAIPWPEWFERTTSASLDTLLGLAVPDVGGHLLRGPIPRGRSAYDNPQELRLYLGLPALLLAVAGARRPGARVFAVAALLAVVLAFPTPLAWPMWAFFPGFKGSSPTRVLWLVHVVAPPLVAAGAADLLRGGRAPRLLAALLVAGLGLLVGVTALLWPRALAGAPAHGLFVGPTVGPFLLAVATAGVIGLTARRPRLAAALLAGLLAWDLLHEAHAYTSGSPSGAFYPETPAIAAAREAAGRDRVLLDAGRAETVLAPFGIRTAGSYASLHSARYAALLDALGSPSPWRQMLLPSRLPAPWRDALAVRAVLAAPGARPRSPDGLTLAHQDEGAWVWTSASALPRARLHAPEAVVEVPDLAAALAAAVRSDVDPRAHVILETGRRGPVPPSPPPPAPVDVLHDEPTLVSVRVSAPRGGVLVLADAWAPGWSCADERGQALPLLPADVALRGVPLPPGFAGEVTFRYETPGARAGAGVSLAAAALLAAVVWLGRRPSVP